MRTLQQNKQKLFYSLLMGEQPVYELDDEGNKIIAYIDDFGIPVITAEFFKLTPQEWNMFWDFVETFKGKY